MNQNEMLTQLVEQAACCVNMLGPSDLSDARQLEEILGRIDRTVHELDRGSDPLRTQLEDAAAAATQTLQQVLGQEVKDTSQALNAIAKAICSLQGLVRQLDSPEQGTGAESSDAVSAAPVTSLSSKAVSSEPAAPAVETPAAAAAMTISPDDAPLVVDFITEATEHIETAESALLELENHPDNEELINKIFRGFHTIKGMAGFLNLTEIGSLAHSAENLLDLARKGKLILAGANSDVVFASVDMLKRMMTCLKEAVESGGPVTRQEQLASLLETLKAAAEGKTPTAPVHPVQTKADDEKLDAILEDKAEAKKTASSGPTAHAAADDKIKVSITRLDNLINMTGELVIAQLMVAEEINTGASSTHDLARKVAHQGKIVRELQELSMSMRMVPVQGVFQKMSRLARDLSRKANKQVDFVTVGEETELDRTVVDKIADPLIHMVRNSLDHGIEPSADRIKAGKNPTGHVELRAFHQAGNIVIEIEDDGKGLDKERILKKAIDAGLVEPGQELSEEEIFKLIFHPGLSTAEKITSISGRGVGMDVVKKNIESLRGKIEISSVRGKGTTFTIRLPLTLAVIDGQVVSIGDQRYIIPINAIVRSLRPTSRQISSVQGRGEMILERGELIPLVRLYRLLGAVPTEEDPTKALVVVVEEDGKKCCLLVDDLLAQQQVVIKSLGDALGRVQGVSGGAIMGDGKVCLILDIPGLVALAQAQ
ncbi:MAG TPA: chemotaxis protein CheA [Sedimentisphaerales bacterium]|nr:chemotaxis protein CheA [Sedimentisphaerales bacterium]HRS10399.1 chemotaxis protein CheA [Sedimentisphaerales bacterium]HRV47104.1 chemotaxis protein CheA [Sedimentisphaerales bacterium]